MWTRRDKLFRQNAGSCPKNKIFFARERSNDFKTSSGTFVVIISLGVVLFQLALAAGAPWEVYAMGGAFPGLFPPALRIAALIQAALLVGMAMVVLARAGLSLWLIWFVVAVATLSLILNLITPRAGERAIWSPTACLLLISSTIVAFSNSSEYQSR